MILMPPVVWTVIYVAGVVFTELLFAKRRVGPPIVVRLTEIISGAAIVGVWTQTIL